MVCVFDKLDDDKTTNENKENSISILSGSPPFGIFIFKFLFIIASVSH